MRNFRRWLSAAVLFAWGTAQAQTTLLDEVRTVGTQGEAVPVEMSFVIGAAGNYEVVLTDLGAPAAPLESVHLALTRGATIVGTPLNAPGTLTFAATASTTYVARVTGRAGAGIGSGLFRVEVRNPATGDVHERFVNVLAPASGVPSEGQFVQDSPLTVTATGSYVVTLQDLVLPQATDTLLLALVEQGGSLVAALDNTGGNTDTETVTLDATRSYRVFTVAVPATPTSGGLFHFSIAPSAGGAAALQRVVPVGGTAALGSATLVSGVHELSMQDLDFPELAAGAGVVLTQAGAPVAQLSAVGETDFTAVAGVHEIYAYAAAAANEPAASINVRIAPDGQPAVFNMARVFASGTEVKAFNYAASIGNAARFRARLADYQFPSAFTSLEFAVVQNGVVLGTPLPGAGTLDVDAVQGRLDLLVLADAATAGGLLGVDVSPLALGPAAFETTEGVGGAFTARRVVVNNSASFDVNVADLGFPADFANLSTAVTRGADRIGLVFGAGTFFFAATPGSYFVNVIAMPDEDEDAGTYSVAVIERPAPPVVTLTASPDRLTSTGGAVDLTWSSQAATSCTASGGWSGTKALSGTERSTTITTATSFTLACSGAGGTTTQKVDIAVAAADPPKSGGGGALDAAWLVFLALLLGGILTLRGGRGARVALAMTALVASLGLAGCGGAEARFARSMERGAEYLETGELDKARVEFRNASQISPQSAQARYQAGVVAERRRDFSEALVAYKSAVDLQADYPEARADLARIYVLGGAPDKALELVAPALVQHPDNVKLLVVRGSAYQQLKQTEEARADAEKAAKLDPKDESAAALLASILRANGERDRAIALIEGTLKHRPKSIDLRLVLSSLQIEAGNMEAAGEQLREAVKADPTQLPLRYQLANFELRNGNVDAAQKTFEQAVAATPDSDDARLVLAEFLATHRSREAGESALRGMIAKDEDNLKLRLGLAALLERAGADKEALAEYQEVITRGKDSPDVITARNRLASHYATHNDIPRAEQLLAEVLRDNPRDIDALGLRAHLAVNAGNPSVAVVDLRTVLREMPSSVPGYRMLARAHIANGEPALAEEALRKALELAPTDTMARVELAQLLTRSGRASVAVSMLEDAVRRAPTDQGVREALVRAYVEVQDLDAATRAVEDLKTLAPNSAVSYSLAGHVAQLDKRFADAEREFERALEVDPRSIDNLAALCRLQMGQGQGAKALARVDGLLGKYDDSAALHNLQGELRLASGQFAPAAQSFEAAIKLTPKWWLPYRNLALARYQAKDAEGAIRAYEAGRKQVPGEIALAVDLASLYELQKRVDDSIRVYEDFLKLTPRNDLAANNLAKVLLTHRHDAASLARAAQLTAGFASSPDPALLDTYGWTLFRQGDYVRAQEVLQRAFDRAPESGSIRYHLALVQVQAGDVKKAIDNLEIAVLSPRGFIGLAEARTLLVDLKSRAS